LALAACNRGDEPENRVAAAAPASEAGPAADANNGGVVAAQQIGAAKVTFEPSEFEECAPPRFSSAVVRWDANAAGAKLVDVKTLNPDGSEGLFATGGPAGSKETGPWVGPKSIIVLRDHATGDEIGRGITGSKPCGS